MDRIETEMGLLRRVVRLYTFNSPVRRGVYRIASAGIRIGRPMPDRLLITASDGRRLVINPADEAYKFVYFTGLYEPAITHYVSKVVSEGDVCVDMGANLGWYTTLFMHLAGESGQVHAFEPMPTAFKLLENNVLLNNSNHEVYANQNALGDVSGKVEMNIAEGVPDGHAAVIADGETSTTSEPARMITLDSYLSEKNVPAVDFVKADIEGSELAALKGSLTLFEQEVPPVFMIEMALDTSERFGYSPDDLISFLDGKRDFEYFAIDERRTKLTRFDRFGQGSRGANVLCVPREWGTERLTRLGVR